MLVLKRSDIVDRFEIASSMYSKIPGSGFRIENDKEYDMNGILFKGHWAYYTNNQFILRCPAVDRPYYDNDVMYEMTDVEDPIVHLGEGENIAPEANKPGRGQSLLFYGYDSKKVEDRGDRRVDNRWVDAMESCFMQFRFNSIIIEKAVLIDALDSIFGKKVNDRANSALVMSVNTKEEILNCKIVKYKKRDVSKEFELEIPITINNPFGLVTDERIEAPVTALNVLYLGLLNVFEENEYITMSFNSYPADPNERARFEKERNLNPFHGMVVFKGYGGECPEIVLGISPIKPNFNPLTDK